MTLIPYVGKDDYEVPFSTNFKIGPVPIPSGKCPEHLVEISRKYQALRKPRNFGKWTISKKKDAAPRLVKSEPNPEENRQRVLNAFRKRGMPVWARQVVEEVANRTGVSLELIASDRRFRQAVHARNEAIYRLKDLRPVLSMPTIAKWFNRDHTSILHSIASHSERTGAPALVGYDLQSARRRNAAFNRWKRLQAQGSAA